MQKLENLQGFIKVINYKKYKKLFKPTSVLFRQKYSCVQLQLVYHSYFIKNTNLSTE